MVAKKSRKNITKKSYKNTWLSLLKVIYYNQVKKQSTKRKEGNNMKNYKITDKATNAIIGVVAMTPDQARRAEKDFIVKEA